MVCFTFYKILYVCLTKTNKKLNLAPIRFPIIHLFLIVEFDFFKENSFVCPLSNAFFMAQPSFPQKRFPDKKRLIFHLNRRNQKSFWGWLIFSGVISKNLIQQTYMNEYTCVSIFSSIARATLKLKFNSISKKIKYQNIAKFYIFLTFKKISSEVKKVTQNMQRIESLFNFNLRS